MNVTLTGYAVAQLPPSNFRYTRYSGNPDGWTTDGLPRQLSVDFSKLEADGKPRYKDYGYPGGLPDQIKYMPDVWIRLNRTRQEWLFAVNCVSAYGMLPGKLSLSQLSTAKREWAELFDDGRFAPRGRT